MKSVEGAGSVVNERYVAMEVLGQSENGVVWRCLDRTLDREVALKLIHRAACGDPARRARFVRRGRQQAQCPHPNLVAVYDTGEDSSGRLYLIMEYIRGRTLLDVLREGAIDWRRAGALMLQLLDALGALHAVGWVLGDLDATQVMVSGTHPDEALKLLPFGVTRSPMEPGAGASEARPEEGPAVGVARSPTARTDLYAAVVLFEAMLVGLAHSDDKRISPPEVPDAVGQIVRRGLDGDPTQRFPTAAEMADAVRAALAAGDQVDAVRPAEPPPEPEPIPFHPDGRLDVNLLVELVERARLWAPERRDLLLHTLPDELVSRLPHRAIPFDQLMSDIGWLIEAPLTEEGWSPIAVWCHNAAKLLGEAPAGVTLEAIARALGWGGLGETAWRPAMVWVPPNGWSDVHRDERAGEGGPGRTVVRRPLLMSRTPITRAHVRAARGEDGGDDQHPATDISAFEAQRYCDLLSRAVGLPPVYASGRTGSPLGGFRLPTVDEWRYACRAGVSVASWTGDPRSLDEAAWYRDNSGAALHPVGQKAPNPWGLFDMQGNVWEWVIDPRPTRAPRWLITGGSFADPADDLRVGVEYQWNPTDGRSGIGFRVVRDL